MAGKSSINGVLISRKIAYEESFSTAMFDNQRVYYGIFPCPWTYPDIQLAAMLLCAMLPYLLLCLHNDGMLRDDIFSWVSSGLNNLAHTQTRCYILISSFAHAQSCTQTLDAVLWYLFCDRFYPWSFAIAIGQVTTDPQHEVAKREAFLYIEVNNVMVPGAVFPM